MKKIFTTLLIIIAFGTIAKAQMKDKFMIMFGGELVHGSYTGISPQVMDDRYKLLNLTTFRWEGMGSRKGNFYFDFSGIGIWTTGLKAGRNLASTYTEKGFHKLENHYVMRLNGFRIRGEENSKGFRFGWGYQLDIRRFGASLNEDNNGQSSYPKPGLSYGPLEMKGRFSGGFNANIVKQSSWLYSRYSINLGYSPGKIQGVSVFPEAIWYVNYKRVALFINASYRVDYLFGNRMVIDFTNIPSETMAISKATHFQAGIALDIWKFSGN